MFSCCYGRTCPILGALTSTPLPPPPHTAPHEVDTRAQPKRNTTRTHTTTARAGVPWPACVCSVNHDDGRARRYDVSQASQGPAAPRVSLGRAVLTVKVEVLTVPRHHTVRSAGRREWWRSCWGGMANVSYSAPRGPKKPPEVRPCILLEPAPQGQERPGTVRRS